MPRSSTKKQETVVNKRMGKKSSVLPTTPKALAKRVAKGLVIDIPIGALPGRAVVTPPKKSMRGQAGKEALAKSIVERRAKGLPLGRPKGSSNAVTVFLRDAIPEALSRLGSDGKGKDGLIGWLMKQGRREPVAMMKLLDKLLPMQIQATGQVQHTYGTLEDITERFKARGLPVPQDFTLPYIPQDDVEADDGE